MVTTFIHIFMTGSLMDAWTLVLTSNLFCQIQKESYVSYCIHLLCTIILHCCSWSVSYPFNPNQCNKNPTILLLLMDCIFFFHYYCCIIPNMYIILQLGMVPFPFESIRYNNRYLGIDTIPVSVPFSILFIQLSLLLCPFL